MSDAKFWRVYVTGGTGFLGRAVVKAVKAGGAEPVVFPSSHYDLRDAKQCREAIIAANADRIIHLAATVGGIGANQDSPGQFFYDNILMGVNVIEQARKLGINRLTLVGTVCSYPSQTPLPFSETSLWNGYPEPTNAPYGIAKKALGVMLDAYHRQYGMKSAYLIPANLYGPFDNFGYGSHVIPALITKFSEAKIRQHGWVELWGTGEPTREFLYVQDAADAIYEASCKIDKPEPINIGSGQVISIRDLADKVCKLMGYEGSITFTHTKPNGQMQRAIDSGRAFGLLKWRPKVDLDKGLMETVRYYKDFVKK